LKGWVDLRSDHDRGEFRGTGRWRICVPDAQQAAWQPHVRPFARPRAVIYPDGALQIHGYPLHLVALFCVSDPGLVSAVGYDTYMHRIVFPLDGNLHRRSLSTAAPPHRFLLGAKGGLYLWEQEGILDHRPLNRRTLICSFRESSPAVRVREWRS